MTTWKTVRVFISSTFRDMQTERDHLVRFEFPKLRQGLLQRRIHLVDVDLRRGVTSEQDALCVCREVVDDCLPWFLCMLGGRYGWAPAGKTRSITTDASCQMAPSWSPKPTAKFCILKLHHGHRRITLAEAEAILVEREELPGEAAPQTQDGKTQDARLEDLV